MEVGSREVEGRGVWEGSETVDGKVRDGNTLS